VGGVVVEQHAQRRWGFALALSAVLPFLPGCDNYGTRLTFNKGELYYTAAVTKDEAQKLGDFLVREKFFDGNEKTVQLNKAAGVYEVRMVIKKGFDQDPHNLELFKEFAAQISRDVYGSAPVDIHLCDEYLKTLRVVSPPR
jgi:hypothetical protein